VSLYYLASYLFFTMHSTVCTVIDLFMCVCHILLINYYYYNVNCELYLLLIQWLSTNVYRCTPPARHRH